MNRDKLLSYVVRELKKKNISVALVGGAVVSIYSDNEYESKDLDFISSQDHREIEAAMLGLGFEKTGRSFVHPDSEYTVEFPPGPVAIGNDVPVIPEGEVKINRTVVKLLSPTQSVMDRLAWFYFSDDMQCLDQAVIIAKKQPIKIETVKAWSKREGELEKFEVFLSYLKNS